MKLLDIVREVRRHLEENGRVSLRMLRRQYELDDEALDELIEELVDVQRIARREEHVLVWSAASTAGAAVHAPGVVSDSRKIISILFADLMGSTALQEGLDPESVNRVMDAYYQAVRGPVEAAGGTVVQLLGDGVMCAFGIPRIAEDDALRAVRAAVGVQQAFREFLSTQEWLRVPIGLRVAVNTGEVVVSDEHPAGIGDPLNVAARLQQEARDGEVLIGQATRRLVADAVTLEQAGVFALKGRAETVTAYRVVSLERPTGATTAAFVGRDDELARIAAVYDAACATPAARLAVVLGSPGLGKSRLIEEVARRLDDARVVTAQCDAAGGATFAPVAEALRKWLGASRVDRTDSSDPSDPTDPSAALARLIPEGPDRARIISGITALLAGSPASPEETFFVIRRFLTALTNPASPKASQGLRPVVLVIDDLHWAEPLLLDLVEHLVQWGSGVPLFVLVGGRPELRDLRSSLATPGGFVSEVVTLSGLDAGAAMRLAANVIGASDLPAAVAAKVLATSEGNPLFVGELVRMLVDEGAMERQGERWIVGANLAALEMPPTIHALLAARIERLRPEERTVLERAAVIGRYFSRSAVVALLSRNGSELDARLEALCRSELIERDTGWFLGEPVLRFHHVLIRDAAYRRLLKGTRAELHATLADWIEAQVGDAAEHDETIGWHLEQAHQFLRELGPLDENGRHLGERAAARLAAAGRRALARDDVSLAASLLGRAIAQLEGDDPARADLALDWCEALLSAGDVGPAAAAIAELGRFADSTDRADPSDLQPSRLRAWHTCFASQLTVLTAPQGLQAAADAVAEAARQLAAQGDAAGEAKAHSVHAQALARLGKVGAAEAALDQALAAARTAGDRRRANAVLAGAPLAALWGPSPVTRASGRCLDVVRVLRITQGAPAVESVALSCQGVLEALRGRTDAARRMLASARKMVEELGIAHRLFEADAFAGRIAAMEGDTVEAERLLRGAYEGLRDLGLGIDAARAGALLARALLAQDRVAEAEALSHESEALAGDDLQAAIAWRGVRAEALAKRGEHAAALELAKAAVTIASATDALLDHADARVALAVALRGAGRGAEADAEERRAIELWEAKGATLLAERARRSPSTGPRKGEAPAEPLLDRRPSKANGATGTSLSRELPHPRRRVRANAAAENAARLAAALAAVDLDAAERQLGDSVHIVHHPTGLTYDRPALLESFRRGFQTTRGLVVRHEALATLGDALCLSRQRMSIDSVDDETVSVGAAEIETLMLEEVDATGRRSRTEVFAIDHVAEAIARLYERYAEILPDGPERRRAAATARSIEVTSMSPDDVDRAATVIAPDFASVDHRPLSTWSMRSGAAFLEHLRALRDVAAAVVIRTYDILALGSNALLTRRLHSGIERVGGGAYERPFLVLFATDADGRLARAEWFDADREAEALARFDALVAGTEPKRPVRRRVRPNAATALQERFEAALAARDFDGVAAVIPASLQEIDHPTGSTYGGDACIASMQRLFRSRQPHYDVERLATLGELLLLVRRRTGASGTESGNYDVGAYENEAIQLFESNERALFCRSEVFAAERLGDAIVRLYERYAELLPEGPERIRAAATARSVAVWNGSIDPDRVAATTAPLIECVDHRILQLWSARGADEFLGQWRGQLDLATGSVRHDDVLAVEPDTLLVRQTYFGNERTTGGFFDHPLLVLFAFGADGRLMRAELWEPGREAEALARFEEITGEAETQREPFANAASRVVERAVRCWAARDWTGILAGVSPAIRMDDRRRMMRLEIGYADFVAQFRMLFDQPASRWRVTLLATRGERLSLHRTSFTAEVAGGGGALTVESLSLTEVEDNGRWIAVVAFEPDDEVAARAELDARFEAGVGAGVTWHSRHRRAIEARDWEAFAAEMAPDFAFRDHRLLGWGMSVRDAPTFVRVMQSVFDLAPDARYRDDHIRLCERGHLAQSTLLGTREGGAFESPMLRVTEVDESGRIRGFDTYDLEHLDRARARFAELAAFPAAVGRFENAASRALGEVIEPFINAATASAGPVIRCLITHDWQGFRQLFAQDFHMSDRRRVVQLELDRDQYVAFTREVSEGRTVRNRWELVATRGERLAVTRSFYEFTDADIGPSEIAFLLLMEVDERGRIVANVRWDLDDIDAVYPEIDARWAAGEANAHPLASSWIADYRRCFAARDWAGMAAILAPDLVSHNHRLVSWGMVHGPAGLVATLQAQMELAPDTQARFDHMRTNPGGILLHYTWRGTREGGAFENVLVAAVELDARGLAHRIDVWEAEQVERAQARFAEIGANTASKSQSARFANAASRAVDRGTAALEARDWKRFAALMAPGFRHYDRTRVAQIETDGREWLASFRQIVEMTSSRPAHTLLGTRGERLALFRMLWRGEAGDIGPSEIDWLLIVEVDDRGNHLAVVAFDADSIDAAYAELDARWARGAAVVDPAASKWLADYLRFFAARDWSAMAALMAPDVLGENHRLVGWGTRTGPAGIVSTLQAQIELAPDTRERVDHVRTCAGALLFEYAWHGTREGGAFENLWIVLIELNADGRARRADVWEPEQLDQAQARFDELRAAAQFAPLASLAKPNAAHLAMARWQAAYTVAFDTGDWDAMRALCAPGFTFADRRRLALLSGDRELMVASARERVAMGARPERWPIGAAGDRVAIEGMLWSGGPADGRFEIEYVGVSEVGESGLFTGMALFDRDDIRAAQREAWARWAAIDPAVDAVTSMYGAVLDAANDRDLSRYRKLFADDLVIEDHRHGIRIDGLDTYAAQVALLWQHAPDSRLDGGWFWPAFAPHGAVTVTRRTGALADEFLWLFRLDEERIARIEVFALDAVDAATARLDELGAAQVP